MSFEEVCRDLYPNTINLDAFAHWSADVLAPLGFRRDNTLAVVSVCRDELMFPLEDALHEQWGAAFNMSGLGAMVFGGRTGFAAASQHAPDIDGRQRFLFIVLPHIGIGENGSIGSVRREGQVHGGTACGALIAARDDLCTETPSLELDPHDIELSLLRRELYERLGAGPAPSLDRLTELARQAATDEVIHLEAELYRRADTDTAIISGIVVHGPRANQVGADRVAVIEAWARLGNDPTKVSLVH